VRKRDTLRAQGRRDVNFHWRCAGLYHLNSIIYIRNPTIKK